MNKKDKMVAIANEMNELLERANELGLLVGTYAEHADPANGLPYYEELVGFELLSEDGVIELQMAGEYTTTANK